MAENADYGLRTADSDSGLGLRTRIADYGLRLPTRTTDSDCRLGLRTPDSDCGLGLRTRTADSDCGLGSRTRTRIADSDYGLRTAEKSEYGVHNFILTKSQHKYLVFLFKNMYFKHNMEYQYLNFFNELLFPTLSNWIVQFTAHAYII